MVGSDQRHSGQPTLLTRGAPIATGGRTGVSLPPFLLAQGVRRLATVSLVSSVVGTIGWLLPHALRGRLLDELSSPKDAVPSGAVIVASVAIYALTRSQIRHVALAAIGLVYQVVVSYGIAFGQYWGTFVGVEAHHLSFDRTGLTLVALWMILFTVLVPNRPRYALIALLASASSVPLTYGLSVSVGEAPALDAGAFFEILVVPYAAAAAVAYFTARTIYRLGTDLKEATEMGAYRLESLVGRGGMGEVWKARHRMLARPAAIKLIRPESLQAGDPTMVESLVKRFEREAQVTATLGSPHTVELYDYGLNDEGVCFFVMELLDGVDLQTMVVEHGPLPAERCVHFLIQACHSLAEAHCRGLVHRDIKPANVFACRQGLEHDFVKVLDFGLVLPQHLSTGDPGLTMDGTLPGTPAYLAPEMARGEDVDFRVDIYSLGCVAYWLLTGRLVFEETSATRMAIAHATREPDPPSSVTELDIPPALESLVMRCLAKSPEQRPANADALAEALRACELTTPWTEARARQWWQQHYPSTSNESGSTDA